MSNLEDVPDEGPCGGRVGASPPPSLLEARDVPLGGTRAMSVRRTLPHKQIRTVGAWCFVDHYGPDGQPMAVPPHPHIGLQTVSWLLAGEVEHRDSLGSLQTIRPGEVNVMTAGGGIAHSEYSVGSGILHGVQLWVALADGHRDTAAAFEHHADLPVVEESGSRACVFMGGLAGVRAPVATFSPIVGAEVSVRGESIIPLEPEFEYAALAVDDDVDIGGHRVPHTALQYLGWGADELRIDAPRPTRILLLGGEPLTEHLVMWWNFVGRSHDEIVQAREQWQAGDDRFGEVVGDPNPRLPAPAMPGTALKPRPARR